MSFVPTEDPVNVSVTDASTAATSLGLSGSDYGNALMVTVVGSNVRVYIAQGESDMGAATVASGECFLGSGQYIMNLQSDATHVRAICPSGESAELTVQVGNV